MEHKKVRPLPGRRVRKLDGSLLAESGESVMWSSHWLRRERDGDVEVLADMPPAKPVKSVKTSKEPADDGAI